MTVLSAPSVNTSEVILFYAGIFTLEKKFGLYLNCSLTYKLQLFFKSYADLEWPYVLV